MKRVVNISGPWTSALREVSKELSALNLDLILPMCMDYELRLKEINPLAGSVAYNLTINVTFAVPSMSKES